ncbi:MAG TPA: hypothetical protein EYN66_18800 [Myxococcales bacterium]|nr:hypothetical protein [Myxococcales bacterium]
MSTHADYDIWEDQVIDRGGATLVYNLYKEAMTHKRGTRRTFVRWMLISYRDELPKQYRESIQQFADDLQKASDRMGPDIRYLLGFMAFKQLTGSGTNPNLPIRLNNGAIVDTVITNWSALAANHPAWRGPRGVTAESVATQVAALKTSLNRTNAPKTEAVTLSAKEVEFWNAFEGFHREYEDLGPKKGCRKVDAALQVAAKPTLLGDAYAHCALDRGNPGSALEQLERMLKKKVSGAFLPVIKRIEQATKGDAAIKKRLTVLKEQLTLLAKNDADYATHCGLTSLLEKTP